MNEPRGTVDLQGLKKPKVPSPVNFYAYLEVFIREAFRFTLKNGLQKRLTLK
ncbi:MAG: hypothetical protein BAJALOKI1v1_1750001, partial [Promethearchaeota archaeon]